jgi:hypothetical protein
MVHSIGFRPFQRYLPCSWRARGIVWTTLLLAIPVFGQESPTVPAVQRVPAQSAPSVEPNRRARPQWSPVRRSVSDLSQPAATSRAVAGATFLAEEPAADAIPARGSPAEVVSGPEGSEVEIGEQADVLPAARESVGSWRAPPQVMGPEEVLGPSSVVYSDIHGGSYGDYLEADPDWIMEQSAPSSSHHGQPWQPTRLWVRPEAVALWIQGATVPALVTTGTLLTPRDQAGKVGAVGTRILFGQEDIGDSVESGGRVRFGFWLSSRQMDGLEFSYLSASAASTDFSASSTDFPILARPFFNVEDGVMGEDVELIAYPGLLAGSVRVQGSTSLETLEVMYRRTFLQRQCERLDLFAGYRQARLADRLTVQDSKVWLAASGPIGAGTSIVESDRFVADNTFDGAQIGLTRWRQRGRWSTEISAKLALGTTARRSELAGQTTVSVPIPEMAPDSDTRNTGLLVQSTNAGVRVDNMFSVLPEVGLTLGYEVSPRLSFTLGYTYMHWHGVMRASNLIDRRLNLSQLDGAGLIGAPRPAFAPAGNGVSAQGVSLGMDYRF